MKNLGLPLSSFYFSNPGISKFIIPISLVLFNLILKIIFLDHRDIAMDEPFTIFYAQADFYTLFEMLKTENNPPLFFILLHFWIKVFGISAFSVRFLPMIFSTLTAPVIYFLGKRFFSHRVGLVAALIFTFSNYQLLFAHEARIYSLFGLLTVVSMYLFLQLSNRHDLRSAIFLAIINILLVYSHFFGFYILVIQLTSCLVIKKFRIRVLKLYMVTLVIVMISYIPYLSIFISRFLLTSMHGTWVPQPILSDLYKMVWKFSNAPVTTVFFLFLLFSAFIMFIVRYIRSIVSLSNKTSDTKSDTTSVIFFWFFLPYFLMFFISFKIPMFLDRYLVFISFGYYFLIGISVSYLGRKKWIFYTLSFISILMMAVTFKPDADNKRRVKEVTQIIKKLKTKESLVVICPSWLDLGFTYYYNQDFFRDYKNLKKNLIKEKIFAVNDISEINSTIFSKASNVIYLEEWATLVDKDNQIYKKLSSHFSKQEQYKIFESFTIYNFIR